MMITLPQKAEGVIIKVSLEGLAMKEIRITDKFSFAGMAILIVSEDIPKGIWMGDKVEKQSVEGDQTVISGEKVLLLTNGTKTMPDINGWSRNDIAKLADLTGITVNYTGSGYAYYQSIAAGGALKKSDIVEVKLK